MDILMYAGSVAAAAAVLLWWYFRVPATIPRDIPRVPVYVNLIAMWYDMSPIELYNARYRPLLEQHGAIAIWFTGTWCVLVAKPEYVVDLFRNDETYPKVGVNVRGSGSLMGIFAGENIINSARPNWGTLSAVMKPGFLKTFDQSPIHEKAKKVPALVLQSQKQVGAHGGVKVFHWMEKYAQDVMSLCLFDFDLQALDEPRVPYAPLLGQIMPAIFSRWSLYFPKLDILGRELFARKTTLQNIAAFDSLLDGIVETTMPKSKTPDEQHPKVVSHLLKDALDSGRLSYPLFRSNLRMTFMFGHDTTANYLTSIMLALGSNTAVQDTLRAEALASPASAVQDLPYLTSTLYEVLRLYPPVTEMLNHTASHPVLLGGKVAVHPGTWLGWNAYGVHTNPAIWGADARQFNPRRWGATVKDIQASFRLQSIKGNYIPFSLHARKCLGQSLVLMEAKLVVYELVRRMRWVVDPGWKEDLGTIMFTRPVGLRVIVEELDEAADGVPAA
ncbi:cytochrome P450 [Aspergillus aurantiobrunneus]